MRLHCSGKINCHSREMQATETAAIQRVAAVSISSFVSHLSTVCNRSNEHNATLFRKASFLSYEVPAGNAICAPTCAQALFMIEPSFHSKLIDNLCKADAFFRKSLMMCLSR